jgi:hypothetical protein
VLSVGYRVSLPWPSFTVAFEFFDPWDSKGVKCAK